MIKEIITFISELDPENEVSKLNYRKLKDTDYVKVAKVIFQWKKDGILVPDEYVENIKFVCRYAM